MNNKMELIKKFYEKYKNQGINDREAFSKAYDSVNKLEQRKYTVEYFREKINNGGYDRLKNMCEHVLLRPNDNKKSFGEKGFNSLKIVVEDILQNYKETDLYKYYYELPSLKYKGLCTFERWQEGFLL
jgi:hypothetical protein